MPTPKTSSTRLFGGCLLLVLSLTGGCTNYAAEQEHNREKGRLLADRVVMQRHWKSLETNEGFRQQIVEKLASHPEYDACTLPALVPKANRPDGKAVAADAFELSLLQKFSAKPAKASADQTQFAERYDDQDYHYYQPFYAETSCIECHRIHTGNRNLSEGDLLAIIHVRFSASGAQQLPDEKPIKQPAEK